MNSRKMQKVKRVSARLLLAGIILAMMWPGVVVASAESCADFELIYSMPGDFAMRTLGSGEVHYRHFPARTGVAALSADDDLPAMLAAALYALNAAIETFLDALRPGVRVILPGDVNGDGVVTELDLLLLRMYLAGHDVEICRTAADMTGNGEITAVDLMLLRLYLAGHPIVSNGGDSA